MSADISATEYTSLDYLNDSFSAISLCGDSSLSSYIESIDVSAGKRDGIGSLWFRPASLSMSCMYFFDENGWFYGYPSLSELIGRIPFDMAFSADGILPQDISAFKTFVWGDGNELYVGQGTTAEHVYNEAGIFSAGIEYESPHRWYISSSGIIEISATEILSADLTVLNASGAPASIFSQGDTAILSATIISGVPTSFEYNFGDGISAQSLQDSCDHIYNIPGLHTPTVRLINNALQTYDASASEILVYLADAELEYLAYSPTAGIKKFYVDISESYDTSASHTGLEADPLTFNEFKDYIETETEETIFGLKGYREISDSISAMEGHRVEAWDASAYGPWILAISADTEYLNQNKKLSFAGCVLKCGILYDLPFSGVGCEIVLSKTLTCFINMHRIKFSPSAGLYRSKDGDIPYQNDCFILGSTIRSEGIEDTSPISAYGLNIIDSVLVGMYPESLFSACAISIYNSSFDRSYADILEDFVVSAKSQCQFNMEIPDPYPFDEDSECYRQDVVWLNANRRLIQPFKQISALPKPGLNYSTYPDYKAGLFGRPRA
jgi:hypothetical protein